MPLNNGLAATAGKHYRLGFTVASKPTTGTRTTRLTGGSDRTGTAITANGIYSDRLQAATGNDTLESLADTSFDGALDNVAAYLETSGCLSQGTHYIWIEPQNTDGLPGPVAGPFEINMIQETDMANGVSTNNLCSENVIDEVLCNRDDASVRLPIAQLVEQVKSMIGPTFETKAVPAADLSWNVGAVAGVVANLIVL